MDRALLSVFAFLLAFSVGDRAGAQEQPGATGEMQLAKKEKRFLAPPRVWKTADGKFEVLAGLLEIDSDQIVLKRADNGYIARVALELLCDEDLEFLRMLRAPAGQGDEPLKTLPEIPRAVTPQDDFAITRPTNPLVKGSGTALTAPDRSAETGGLTVIEKGGIAQQNEQDVGNLAQSPEDFRRFGESQEHGSDIIARSRVSGQGEDLAEETLPDMEAAMSASASDEVRLKPSIESGNATSNEAVAESGVPKQPMAEIPSPVLPTSESADGKVPDSDQASLLADATIFSPDVFVSAELTYDSRIKLDSELELSGKGILIRFWLSGRDSTAAFRAGELVLHELKDSDGRSLEVRRTPPNRCGLSGAWTPLDATLRSCNLALALPEGHVVTGLNRLKGEFKVDFATTEKTFSLPVKNDSPEAISLMEEHGVSAFFRRDSHSIVLEISGNVLDVSRVELEGANPEKLVSSSEIGKRTGWHQFDCVEGFPESVVVKLTVVTNTRQATIPFELEAVSFAGAEN